VVENQRITNGFVPTTRKGPPPRSFAPMRMAASWYRSYRIAEYKVAARSLGLRALAGSPLVAQGDRMMRTHNKICPLSCAG
jgi:hypothetical protein